VRWPSERDGSGRPLFNPIAHQHLFLELLRSFLDDLDPEVERQVFPLGSSELVTEFLGVSSSQHGLYAGHDPVA
jgi:hypothetical protein